MRPIVLLAGTLLAGALLTFGYSFLRGEEHVWSCNETGGPYVEVEMSDCVQDCKLCLHYFWAQGFYEGRPTILYVPSVAAQPITRQHPLGFLQDKYNVVYFHVRGTGRSQINRSNTYDRYLRGSRVAEDIEKLRERLLGDVPWAAIYAHSYGTTVAQRYAHKFAQDTESNPKVEKLVLSAPISRNFQKVDVSQRSAQTIDNLLAILNHCQGECVCNGAASPPDDFCFLDDGEKNQMRTELGLILDEARNIGGLSFIIRHYEDLANTNFVYIAERKYPKEFFVALRTLEQFGSESFTEDEKHRQKSAALMIGYVLLSAPPYDSCTRWAAFWHPFNASINTGVYCGRWWGAKLEHAVDLSGMAPRARRVFGIYDGINESVLTRLEFDDPDGCAASETLADIEDENEVFMRELGKVGINPGERICPWNPEDYAHPVVTLILTGEADPVIAGCQTDHVYMHALTGPRAWIEFPGAGHSILLTTPDDQEQIVKKFLDSTFIQFIQDPEVAEWLPRHLDGVVTTPTQCQLNGSSE